MQARRASWLLAGLFALLPCGGASAAPQILAALPSETGIPFTCDDTDCRAELSTYCMLRNRPAPALGEEYVPAVKESFTLVVTDSAGRAVDLPAVAYLRFFESRGFMSIAAQISRADLQRLGAVKAAVRVGPNASLLPVPRADDPHPLTEKEIAYATGSLREESAKLVEAKAEAATARVLAAVANHLPYGQEFDTGEFENLVNKVMERIPAGSPDRAGVDPARARLDACQGDLRDLRFRTMRRCVEWKHDELIRGLNIDYWDSQIGS